MRASSVLSVASIVLVALLVFAGIYEAVRDSIAKRRCWESGGGVLFPHSESKWRCVGARGEAE